MSKKTYNNGMLSMLPNNQHANATHGGTAASLPFAPIVSLHITKKWT